ncbi:MAG: hypothetical protein PHP92_03460 [Candidatus Nanoarchaeia archaeon]|nr:hypothetical protein [Candidatus Nanoarchaeia archaeon]
MKNKKTYKVKVGECFCCLDDPELGCSPFNNIIPVGAIKFHISCKYEDRKYTAIKCRWKGRCDYQHEVTEYEVQMAPNLFERDDE